MISRISILLLFVLASASPADAAYLYGPNGSFTYVPDEIAMLAALIVLAACVWLLYLCIEDISSSSSVARKSLDLPEEVREPKSVDYYEDITARTRALKRKLDADTELAESYIKAARTRAELDDLDDEAHRRAVGRR